MSNQTIDGVLVPRELLSYWAECLESAGFKDRPAEMRALLDAPAGTDWKVAHDTVLDHHRETFAEHIAEIEKLKVTQPRGEPVAWIDAICLERMGRQPQRNFVVTGQRRHTYDVPLYAEQPAPVAVVLPERKEIDKYGEFYDSGWNDCLDDLKRLNKAKY